ncbi:MAG TPA: alpha/beta hydrolase [Acidimicrobiales bacterium]|nr:alpha/beta hydrolase [Acidimicrobiales bacterium]
MRVGARHLYYAVSDNEDARAPDGTGRAPVWAVNVHGYFAGGRTYWRESVHLAEQLGWRVVNPCLPGFGGSDPLGWHEVSIGALAEQIAYVVDHLDTGPVVLLGHSMGGAVAVQYAHDRPDETLGIVYRDGVATPAWRDRNGPVQTVMGVISPNMAPFVDLFASFVADVPDLLVGAVGANLRDVLPDVRRNVRTMGLTLPVGAMLMTVDLRDQVRALADAGLPMLAEWGSFDRVVGAATADEFARCARTTVQWVPGGHSWMLARPRGQADVLTRLDSGRAFMDRVGARRRGLSGTPARTTRLRPLRSFR